LKSSRFEKPSKSLFKFILVSIQFESRLKIFKSLTFELKSLFEKLKRFFCSPFYPALFSAHFDFLSFTPKLVESSGPSRPNPAHPRHFFLFGRLSHHRPGRLLHRASPSAALFHARENEMNQHLMAFIPPTELTPPRLPSSSLASKTSSFESPSLVDHLLNSPPQLYKRSPRPRPFALQPVLAPTFISSRSRACHQAPPPPTCPPHCRPISTPLSPIRAASKDHRSALLLLPLPW
jgi:hypothetical protein